MKAQGSNVKISRFKLNIFTNCIDSAPSVKVISKTFRSFKDTFGDLEPTIYVDPNPNKRAFPRYIQNLYDTFGFEMIETSGLADGYIRSIEEGKADYLFQLEHDWTFQNIEHSLEEILSVMEQKDLIYLRFNKFENQDFPWLRKWQTFLTEQEYEGFRYCLTDNLSNNPHIINRKYYLDNLVNKIDRKAKGSEGVEQNLEKRDYVGALYGGIGHRPTIVHIDGRRQNTT